MLARLPRPSCLPGRLTFAICAFYYGPTLDLSDSFLDVLPLPSTVRRERFRVALIYPSPRATVSPRFQFPNTDIMDIDMSRRNTVPRPLSDDERAILDEYIDSIHYSAR